MPIFGDGFTVAAMAKLAHRHRYIHIYILMHTYMYVLSTVLRHLNKEKNWSTWSCSTPANRKCWLCATCLYNSCNQTSGVTLHLVLIHCCLDIQYKSVLIHFGGLGIDFGIAVLQNRI